MPNTRYPYTVVAECPTAPEEHVTETHHTLAYSKHKAAANVAKVLVGYYFPNETFNGSEALDLVRIVAVFKGHQKNLWDAL